jgi:hypothetical protein
MVLQGKSATIKEWNSKKTPEKSGSQISREAGKGSRTITVFVVVAIIGQGQLGPNQDDLFASADHAAIKKYIFVFHWKANIEKHIFTDSTPQDFGERLPGVEAKVAL